MPNLRGVVTRFSSAFTKATGEVVYGYFRPPQSVRASFDGLFSPRFMLACTPDQNVVAGDVLQDAQGSYFLCGSWSPSFMVEDVIANVFVAFDCNVTIPWTRSTLTTEPISGLQRAGPQTLIQMVQALKEPIALVKDGMNIQVSKYRVLVGFPVQLDDELDGARVQRAETINGLTYCETV